MIHSNIIINSLSLSRLSLILLTIIVVLSSSIEIKPLIIYVPPIVPDYDIVHSQIHTKSNPQQETAIPHDFYVQKIKESGVSNTESSDSSQRDDPQTAEVRFEKNIIKIANKIEPVVGPILDYLATRQVYPNARPKDPTASHAQSSNSQSQSTVVKEAPPAPDPQPFHFTDEDNPDIDTPPAEPRPQQPQKNQNPAQDTENKIVLRNDRGIAWKVGSTLPITPFVVENGVQITLADTQTKSVSQPVLSAPSKRKEPKTPLNPSLSSQPKSTGQLTTHNWQPTRPDTPNDPSKDHLKPIEHFPAHDKINHPPESDPKGVLIVVVCAVVMIGACLVVFGCTRDEQPIITNIQSKLDHFRHGQSQRLESQDEDDDGMLEEYGWGKSKSNNRY